MGTKNEKNRPCESCGGTGWIMLLISRIKCPDCKGTGIAPQKATAKAKSPALADMSGRHSGHSAGGDMDEDDDLEFDDHDYEPLWYHAMD